MNNETIEIVYIYLYTDPKSGETILKLGTTGDLFQRVETSYKAILRDYRSAKLTEPENVFIGEAWYVFIAERNHLHKPHKNAGEYTLRNRIKKLFRPMFSGTKTTTCDRYFVDNPSFTIDDAGDLMYAALHNKFNVTKPRQFDVRRTLDIVWDEGNLINGGRFHDKNMRLYLNQIKRNNHQLGHEIELLSSKPHRIGL